MPVALGVNGGVLGSNNLPTATTFRGVFTPNEVARAIALGFWPVNKSQAVTGVAGSGALGTLTIGSNADPYFNLTTLLLSTTATNGQQNNTFQDSSTNNFTITRNPATGPNAPTQGTFSPFSQTGWGNYFDGTSDYLTVNDNAALELGSSNFCLEFMYYPTSSANTDFVTKRVNAASYGLIIVQTGLALNFWLSSSGSSWDLFSNAALGSVTLNAWNHLAIYRIGNAWYSSLNGTITTLSASLSGSVVNNAANWNIGGNNYASGSVIGYLSNFRLVIGSSVYTSTSAPIPTAPLTAVTNTQLLTCQSNRFVDNSANNFAVTPTGNTTVVPFSPFNPTSAWSASTVGGSGYFDGTGDYLDELTATTAFNLSSGDWTLEAWIYRNAASANHAIVNLYNSAGSNTGLTFYVNSSNQLVTDNGATAALSAGTVPSSSWVHLAISRNSGTTTGYINGVSVGTTTQVPSAAQYARIGNLAAGPYNFNGYIANVRIVKGTAVYTGNFTPPTAPLSTSGSASASAYPSTTNVNTSFASSACSLLLNFTNFGIYDATAKNVLETVGNAQVSTTQSKWSPTSMYFDGTGDYLSIPSNELLAFGTGDFTIEMWVYWNNVSSTQTLFDFRPNATGSSISPYIELTSSGTLIYYVGGATRITTSAVTATSWTHVALSRSGTSTKIFINGTQSGSTYTDSNSYVQSGATIGLNRNNGGVSFQYMNGYIQDLRITKGYARYTANFTPPTAAFPVR